MTSSQVSPDSFSGRDRRTRAGDEDLAPGSGEAVEPGRLQPADDLGMVEPGDAADVDDLAGAERVQRELREGAA
jgi:hypothetical protein